GPLHPADHDVRAVLVGVGHHAFQRLGAEVVVGPHEIDVPARGDVQRAVTGSRGTTGVLLVDHLDRAGILCRETIELRPAVVRGAVVHRNDLQAVQPDALPHQGVEAVGEVGHRVVDRHDHADIGYGAHRLLSHHG